MASFLHQHRKRVASTPVSLLDPTRAESDVSEQTVVQPSRASETEEPNRSATDPSSHALGYEFGAIDILPSDPASLAALHIVPTQAHVTARPVQPRWMGPGAVAVQRNGPEAPVMEPPKKQADEVHLPGPMDIEPVALPPASKGPPPEEVPKGGAEPQGEVPKQEEVPEEVPKGPEEAPEEEEELPEPEPVNPLVGAEPREPQPEPQPQQVAGELVDEARQGVPDDMPNAQALVLASPLSTAAKGGPEAAEPSSRSGLAPGLGDWAIEGVRAAGSRVGRKASAAWASTKRKAQAFGQNVSAVGTLIGLEAYIARQRVGRAASAAWASVNSGATALGQKVVELYEGMKALGPANVAKFFGGTVTPPVVSIGGLLSNAGVRIAQMLEPARDLVGAAGHVLSPVGLASSVLSFVLAVRSAFTSHMHFKNLERLARAVAERAADQESMEPEEGAAEEEISPDLVKAVQFAAGQKERKRNIKALSSAGGALSVAGGTLGVAAAFGAKGAALGALFGVALSAVPVVGLALALTGAAVAIGIILYRRHRSKLKVEGTKPLKFGLTRERAADIIYEAAQRVQNNQASPSEHHVVLAALKELKLDVGVAAGPTGKTLILRKIKS